jgi:hypothetical protein
MVLWRSEGFGVRGAFDPLVANGALFPDEALFGPKYGLDPRKRAISGVRTGGGGLCGVGSIHMEWTLAAEEWSVEMLSFAFHVRSVYVCFRCGWSPGDAGTE